MRRQTGSGRGVGELAVVLLVGVAALAVAVIVGPVAQEAPAPPAPPRSDIYRGPDAGRGPLDRRIVFTGVPEGWVEAAGARDFLGLGGRTATVTTQFVDASGATGSEALPPLFVCMTYAAADTCTLAGPELIATRRVGSGVLMKVTGISAQEPTAAPVDAATRRQWRSAPAVSFAR